MEKREIKHRVFDDEEETMWTVDGLEWTIQGMRISFVRSYPPHYNDAMPHRWEYCASDKLMQYTGLKDTSEAKNEIYEGDIVRVTNDFGDKTIHEIKYCIDSHYPAFDLVPDLDCDSNSLSYIMVGCGCETIEVIGNIYENKELLDV